MLPGPARSSSYYCIASAWKLVLQFAVALMTPSAAIAQVTYHPCCISTPPPEAFLLADAAVECRIDGVLTDNWMPNGTFVQTWITNLRIHTVASVAGSCLVKINGVPYDTEERNINTVHVTTVPPVGNSNTLNITPNDWTQHMDSRPPGIPFGVPSSPSEHGKYRYQLQTRVMLVPAGCNFVPELSPVTEAHIFSSECRPQWHLVFPHMLRRPPPGEITLNIPSDMSGLRPIAELVRDDLAALGITINVVENQPCGSMGGRCVLLDDQLPIPPQSQPPFACAERAGAEHSPETGEWVTPTTINFRSDWSENHPLRNQRRLGHELLHYLGVAHQDTPGCTVSNSIMNPVTQPWDPQGSPTTQDGCNTMNPPDPTMAIAPSPLDRAALANPTYPNLNRKVCGFPIP
jgi:hypothetical protein